MKIDKQKIKKSFSKSAPNYDRYAILQREMAEKLFSSLAGNYRRILDVGSGTGTLAGMLAEKHPSAKVVGVDIAPGMVEVASSRIKKTEFVVGDGEALPFEGQQFDLVVSSASLQWMEAEKALTEAMRVLKPGGDLYFTTFGPATLKELKKMELSVNEFSAKEDLYRILSGRFKQVEIRREIATRRYRDIFELFNYLKEIGAQLPGKIEKRGLLTSKKMEALFQNIREGIEISYEIYYGFCLSLLT